MFLAPLLIILVSMVLPTTALASGSDGEDDWIRDTGDILQIALPVLAGGATFFTNPDSTTMWDKDGTWMFAKTFGLAWGTTYFIKIVAAKARPNGDNRTSFPSGHTMAAFTGAGFIDGRYGRAFGIPAYALALFTGYSRVNSGWHYQDDVLAGASIGLMSNWLLVSPLPGKVQFVPTVDRYGYGFQMSIGAGGEEPADSQIEDKPRGTAFGFHFGPAFVINNTAGSKNPGDNNFVLSDLNGFNDPTTTAIVSIGVPVSSRGLVRVAYGPFEARDEGAFTYDVNFGGAYFPAGTELDSSWRYYDLNAYYEHKLLDDPNWAVSGGIGAGVMYSYASLQAKDNSASALVDDQTFYPFLGLTLERLFSRKFGLEIGGEGMVLSDEWILDMGVSFIWKPVRAWDLSLGYEYFSRQIDTDVFYNKVSYHTPFISITRYW